MFTLKEILFDNGRRLEIGDEIKKRIEEAQKKNYGTN